MTQIVYDGTHLYADRKIYDNGYFCGEKIKLKSSVDGNITRYYALTGDISNVTIAEKIIESDFDPEIIRWAEGRLGANSSALYNEFGLLVEVDKTEAGLPHRVYHINCAGDKTELLPNQFLAVGALSNSILDVYNTVTKLCEKSLPTEDIIRFALQGTHQTQDGYIIDRVDLSNGKFEEV